MRLGFQVLQSERLLPITANQTLLDRAVTDNEKRAIAVEVQLLASLWLDLFLTQKPMLPQPNDTKNPHTSNQPS